MVAVAILTVCVSLLSSTISSTVAHTAVRRERTLALVAAKNVLEDMHKADFGQLFALYNHEPADDPQGESTAPGPHFEVPGLTARAGDSDGFVGEIVFSTPAPPLLENAQDSRLGLPRDLDGDHVVDGEDHSTDYIVLPVSLRLEWASRAGDGVLELTTMFADLSKP